MNIVFAQAVAAAQSATPIVNPAVPSSQDQLIQVSLALVVVLALIYAVAWFVKRKQGLNGYSQIPMKTLGVLPMGIKEKIILIEVGDKQILLGMTPHTINTLATFDEPILTYKEKDSESFAHKLKNILAQQSAKHQNDKNAKANYEDD